VTPSRDVKVSVHMPAYNHAAYIAQAIESVLMQQVDFPYEIVIGEDCSPDGTRDVASDYARRHPGIIRVLLHERNLGIYDNDQAIIRACRGEYIAWLEADDYWTSPHKLQMQVDLLDARADYSACFHRAGRIGTDEPATWRQGPREIKPFYTIDDLLEEGHFIPSCTAVFRANLVREPAEWTRLTPFLERTYSARFAHHGKIGFIDEEMAVFRYHSGGIYAQASRVGNVESAIQTHELIGHHLGVSSRKSYWRGWARLHRELASEHLRELDVVGTVGAFGRSLSAIRHLLTR
jgi:glycosyltransferase involved in cell wall biosynthesis